MPDQTRTVTGAILVIGDEILSGRTQDANIQMIALYLNELGVSLSEVRVVPDDEDRIVAAVNALRTAYDYVFTTGGIGPTHDDITADSIAKAFGVGIDYHPEALRIMAVQYETPDEFTEARKRMARIPFGGTLIDNPISKAPGFQMENVFVLAGIPIVAKAMIEGLADRIVGGAPVRTRTIAAFLTEGHIAEPLGAIQERYPEVKIGSYPFFRQGRVGVSLVMRSTDDAQLGETVDLVCQVVRALGQEPMEISEE